MAEVEVLEPLIDCQRERCGHSADDHIVAHDDSNEAAWDRMCDGDELAHVRFECCWPVKHDGWGARVLCDCEDYVPLEGSSDG